MKYNMYISLISYFLVILYLQSSFADYPRRLAHYDSAELREYCEFETFEPQCYSNEVIVMKEAFYGRMKLGKCVEADLGYLGCSKDVLDIADSMCSGKNKCSIKVPNPDFDRGKKPCYKELKSYLEASYFCYPVIQSNFGDCTVHLTSNPSRISIPAWIRDSCGTEGKPWIVETLPGQRLNVSLIDFSPFTTINRNTEVSGSMPVRSTTSMSKFSDGVDNCVRSLAKITDIIETKSQEICGDSAQRERWVLETTGNQASVVIKSYWPSSKSSANDSSFLIQFEGPTDVCTFLLGCADLKPPSDGWLKREGNELIVGCHSSRQTWHLFCEGRRWNGVIGNCTARSAMASKAALMDGFGGLTSPHSVAVLTVAAISLALCFMIVCLGIACYKRIAERDRKRFAAKARIRYDNVAHDDDPNDAYRARGGPTYNIDKQHQQDQSHGSIYRKNGYKHVWERPLPEPTNETMPGPGESWYNQPMDGSYPPPNHLSNEDLTDCNRIQC